MVAVNGRESADNTDQGISLCDRHYLHYLRLTSYNLKLRSLNALTITETELNVIAALAIIGDSRIPTKGNKTPAAIGTPITL